MLPMLSPTRMASSALSCPMISSQATTDAVVSKGRLWGSHRHLSFSTGTSSKRLSAMIAPLNVSEVERIQPLFSIRTQNLRKVNEDAKRSVIPQLLGECDGSRG